MALVDRPVYLRGRSSRQPGSISDPDIQSLSPSLKIAFADATPGAFTLFCYSMDTDTAEKFETSLRRLCASIETEGVTLLFLGVEKDRSSLHLAALLSNNAGALSTAERSLRDAARSQFRREPLRTPDAAR